MERGRGSSGCAPKKIVASNGTVDAETFFDLQGCLPGYLPGAVFIRSIGDFGYAESLRGFLSGDPALLPVRPEGWLFTFTHDTNGIA